MSINEKISPFRQNTLVFNQKRGNPLAIELIKDAFSKEWIQNNDKVSSKFGRIAQSSVLSTKNKTPAKLKK